jgi:predicted GIY-YIG superfamily endonuclease
MILSPINKGEIFMIGVYKITNIKNNKAYIGISTDIEDRWKQHKSKYN